MQNKTFQEEWTDFSTKSLQFLHDLWNSALLYPLTSPWMIVKSTQQAWGDEFVYPALILWVPIFLLLYWVIWVWVKVIVSFAVRIVLFPVLFVCGIFSSTPPEEDEELPEIPLAMKYEILKQMKIIK